MLSKQYSHMENPQAVLLLITSQLRLIISPHLLYDTFFLLAEHSFHSCISPPSPGDPLWEEVPVFRTALQ